MSSVVGPHSGLQIGNNTENAVRIELRRVRRKHDPEPHVAELLGQRIRFSFPPRAVEKLPDGSFTRHVVHAFEGRVFERIEQNHLPFHVLHESEKQPRKFVIRKLGPMFIAELHQDRGRRQAATKSILAGFCQ